MKILKIFLISLAILELLYLVGPKPPKPLLVNQLHLLQGSPENHVANNEHKPGLKIRPGCEARIIWANDSLKQKTEYVVLYLHGFSASWREGSPVNEDFVRTFGCNAFFARLAGHGEITEDPLLDMTPDNLYASALDALDVAMSLGQKVIIMGCSTGCTLALKLAAEFPGMVDGLILYSPNIQIKNKAAMLLSGHWGLQIARLNYGGKYRVLKDDPNSEVCKYWYCRYRAEGTVYLQQLLDVTMTKELFAKVKCPVFMGYYYKDEANQDDVVEVKASLRMMDELGTTAGMKRSVAFPEAKAHVITSDLISGAVPEVRKETFRFASEILGMKPVR